MLARVYTTVLSVLFFALLAVATPAPWGAPPPTTTTVTVTAPAPSQTPIPAGQCNTGSIQCCNQVQAANSNALSGLLGLLGVVVQPITALVGLDCSPISIIGVGGNSCKANPVCCQNNAVGGLISIGCIPISL